MQFFFFQAFLLIFFSELGDKTFFIAVRVEHNMFNKLFQMLVSELGVLMHSSLHELEAKFVFNVHGLSSLILPKIIRQYSSQSHRGKKGHLFNCSLPLLLVQLRKITKRAPGHQLENKFWKNRESNLWVLLPRSISLCLLINVSLWFASVYVLSSGYCSCSQPWFY